MATLFEFQRHPNAAPARRDIEIEFASRSSELTHPLLQSPDRTGSELVVSEIYPEVACVRLDWEGLQCFEIVHEQFRQWGVVFSNAIALQPSNPAFPARSGKMVVMGSPREGVVEARFDMPVSFVTGFVTSSRRAVLLAYDDQEQLIGRVESVEPNLAGSRSSTPPNIQLSLKAANIHRVTFQTFDGQITLDDFGFSH